MTIVVGYTPQESGTTALELAVVLARSLAEPLVVTAVITRPHLSTEAPVDQAYVALMRQWAEGALAQARSQVPEDLECSYDVREAGSIVGGLGAAAAEHEASMVVLGSSAKGLTGRITLGSVIEGVVHGFGCPVALAPRGFRAAPGDVVDRITVAFGKPSGLKQLVEPAQVYAARIGASVRFASFLIRPFKRALGTVEASADDLVVDSWATRIRGELEDGIRDTVGEAGLDQRLVVGDGITWAEAIGRVDWRDGDLVLIGASSLAPAARVFLGSRASKLVRNVPVPVLMLPRR